MKVLIDTNVALDILLKRRDYADAFAILRFAEEKIISCYISAVTPAEFLQTIAIV